MSDWRKLFVGRNEELRQLKTAWDKAVSGKPQLVVLLAPPGMGKTRLIQEFYHELSQTHDGMGAKGYWPDQLVRERDRFALSSPAEQCDPNNPMTMLWWAIKCIDTGSNSAASSDLLLAYNQYLKPHLDVRRTDEQIAALRKQQLKEAGKASGDTGVEIGLALGQASLEAAIPVVGPFIGLLKTIGANTVGASVELRKLEKEITRLKNERGDLGEKARAIEEDFEEKLMRALRNFAQPENIDLPRCPIALVVDDAQFADADPALRSFLRRLIDTAWKEGWPILVLMTHWTYEWNLYGDDLGRLPGLIQMTMQQNLLDASIISLGKLKTLDQVLRTAILDLPNHQSQALLEKAGGNARYMDRLIQLLLSSPAMFVERSAKGALHGDALEEILREGFDLHDVTRRLFDSAPEEARRAAALASAQGERFLNSLVHEVAEELDVPPLGDGLEYCANPLAVISNGTSDVGEFSQGMFCEVARSLVPRTINRENVVRRALIDLCKRKLNSWSETQIRTGRDPVSDLLLLDLAIGLTAKSRPSEDAATNVRASLRKGDLLRNQGDLEGARAIFDAIEFEDAVRMVREGLIAVSEGLIHTDWHVYLSNFVVAEKCTETLRHIAKEKYDQHPSYDARRELAIAESKVGDVLLQIESPTAAHPHFEQCLMHSKALAEELGTLGARLNLAIAESRIGDVLLKIESPTAARRHFEQYLTHSKVLAEQLGTPDARLNLVIAKSRFGDVLLQTKGPVAARRYYKQSLAHSKALAEELGTPGARQSVAAAERRIGDVLLQIEGPAAARPHFEEYLTHSKALADELATPGVWRNLAIAESKMGDVLLWMEGPAAARLHFEKHLTYSKALAEELGTPSARLEYARAESRMGDILLWTESPAAARPHFEQTIELLEVLAKELGTPGVRLEFAIAKCRMGDVLLEIEGPDAARAQYEEPLAHLKLLANELDTPGARRSLAIAESKMGDVVLRIDGAAAARPHYKQSLEYSKALSEELGTSGTRQGLAIGENKMGDVVLEIEGPAASRPHFVKYLRHSEALARELGTPDAQRELAIAEGKVGDVLLQIKGPATARPYYERAVSHAERAAAQLGPTQAISELKSLRKKLASVEQELGRG